MTRTLINTDRLIPSIALNEGVFFVLFCFVFNFEALRERRCLVTSSVRLGLPRAPSPSARPTGGWAGLFGRQLGVVSGESVGLGHWLPKPCDETDQGLSKSYYSPLT